MPKCSEISAQVAVVAIGRNEGERLKKCLESVRGLAERIVYVDSGSTDGSAELARTMGADVVELETGVPFTAARARNEGFGRLRALFPSLAYVQFVDGDCEVVNGWIDHGVRFLETHRDIAIVCGRRRERYPERSLYNMLCDIEWDGPVGEIKACGGDALVRSDALEGVNGYRSDLIAGEEPELCVRLRAAGWRIWRLGEATVFHDAAMARFGQWWTRALRAGFAVAQGVDLHGAPPERHKVRESRSAWFWGLGVPLAVFGLVLAWGTWALLLLLVYPLQIARLALRGRRSGRENWWYAGFMVLGKFALVLGQMNFLLHKYFGKHARLIEYK